MTTNVNVVGDSDLARALQFFGGMSAGLGSDQIFAGDDAITVSPANVNTVATPSGAYAMEGQARSNMQGGLRVGGAVLSLPVLLIVGVGAYLYFNKG